MLRLRWLVLIALFAVTFSALRAQTFRGALSGTVVDVQGAVIPGASIQLKNPATATVVDSKSNKDGEFNFPELPPGVYQLTVSFQGFQTQKIDNIEVNVSKVANVKVSMNVGTEATVVDVAANAVSVDTTTSSLVSVVNTRQVADMPINGRDFTQMVKFTPGDNLSGSVNGQRTTSINYQIDGTDNVDAYLGIVASNQGGIASVPGGLVPIEAIDQFSMQSNAEADMGRNAGANQNMVLKSGTNQIHGDVFFYNRNEFFAAISPVAPVGARKPPIRNNQFGFTLGGPLWKDHTFLFLAGEIQLASAGNSTTDTVLNDAWIADAGKFLQAYGISYPQTTLQNGATTTGNPLSIALYNTLYPRVANSTGAVTNNWFATSPDKYNSYNGVIKLDHHFSQNESLSIRYLGTTGQQTAVTGSYYPEFFQTAPMHIHNFSVIQTSIIKPNLLNQVQLGTNFFLQTFNDADQNFNPGAADGLTLGLTGIIAAGSPTIAISGFDEVGATQPSGRTDVTGQVVDSLRWTLGKHSLRFGGEYRHANVNLLYFSNSRGTFTFDGTRGPWAKETTADNTNCNAAFGVTTGCTTQMIALADYLNGQPSNSSTSKLLQGNAERVYLLNTYDFWAQDDFTVTPKLTVNYGVRWSLPGHVYDAKNDLSSFVPGKGFVTPLYNNYYGAFAPRVGFAYSPLSNNKLAIRGAWGLYYDVPGMTNMVSGYTGNGGDSYTQNNPSGPDPAYTLAISNFTWAQNVNPFTGAALPQLGAMGVQPNYRIQYSMNTSLNIEQQLTNSTLFTIGYVGTQGRRLAMLYDLNQPINYNFTTKSYIRPYDSTLSFPGQTVTTGQPFAGINQVTSGASANYNSLQAVLRQSLKHGFSITANYTWAHSMDDASSDVTPMNSHNIHQDYGPSTFDIRNTLTGFASYQLPKFTSFAPRLTQGYQFNALFDYNTGTPLSVLVGKDYSLTDEQHDRVSIVQGVNPYVGNTTITASTSRAYQYLAKAAYAYPVAGVSSPTTFGVYGNEQRDGGGRGPKFGTMDFSMFKHTPITERVNSEFRVEIFNIFNQRNFANPSITNLGSGTFGEITQTKNGSGAPGLGYGEPFNIQFAFKISF
ncbi:TonB-dependent receptor [Granulicella sp. 5B5]|uniref:TonB-dependent receptor n=1 Tax=Granulicella sp. 5B5 TaxID=1617967 RepID=UPI0015F645F1|nr:TonB-dependent receptor [Granulicella sp. 5B5]QMV19416.1 TonB-dependent receptor [Granulicella sp. 5B5]